MSKECFYDTTTGKEVVVDYLDLLKEPPNGATERQPLPENSGVNIKVVVKIRLRNFPSSQSYLN